jgi:hypothetical protein
MMLTLDCPITKEDWVDEIEERNGVSVPSGQIPVSEQDADPWEPAVRQVVELKDLGDDWDGFGAQAPSRELLQSAIGLAYCFRDQGVDPPHRVVPGVCGSVIYEWQDADGTYTEVEIDRPLHAEVMVVEPGQAAKHWTLPSK